MKKIMNWMLAAILVCGASVFTSCMNDTIDNPTPSQPEEEGEEFVIPEEPTTDQLEVKVTADMPTAVLSSFSDNSMGAALRKRVSKTTNAIGDDTKFVIFKGSDIQSISNDVWEQMARVYLNGGYIGIERATNKEMLAFAVVLGLAAGAVQYEMLEENDIEVIIKDASNSANAYANELQRRVANASALTRAVANEEEDPDGIDFEMFILSLSKSFSQAPYNAEETITSKSVDEDGNETTSETKVQHLQNAYHYGLLADGAAAFLNQMEKEKAEAESESEAPALTRGAAEQAMNDVLNCSDEFVINHGLYAIDPNGNEIFRNNVGTTTIKSWSVHDFGSKQDFYYLDEKVVIRMGGQNSDYNKTLYWGPYPFDAWNQWPAKSFYIYEGQTFNHYYGSWLSEIKHSLDLQGKGTITVEASVPSTDNSSENKSVTVGTTDGTSSTEGWNIGFGGSGDSSGKLSAGFNFGYSSSTTTSHSNSFSMAHGSTNKALKMIRNTVGTQVSFKYDESVLPDWSWNPFKITHFAPDILTNDCEVNNMVCWRVKNPSDSYKLAIKTYHRTGAMIVADSPLPGYGEWRFIGTDYSDGYSLKQPCRYMGMWNCDVAITGKNHVANASEEFRKYLQNAVVEAAFRHQFNVAERQQGEMDVMKNLIATIGSKMKKGSAKRRMINNHAKELGIESYTITWFSEDPDIKQEFMLADVVQ